MPPAYSILLFMLGFVLVFVVGGGDKDCNVGWGGYRSPGRSSVRERWSWDLEAGWIVLLLSCSSAVAFSDPVCVGWWSWTVTAGWIVSLMSCSSAADLT